MDFGKALLLIAVVLVLTDVVKQIVPNLDARLTVLVAVAIGIAATFLTGASVWANEQVVGGHSLGNLDTPSKLLVGLMVGTGAGVTDKVLNAVRNIGQNQGSRPPSE